MSQPLVFRAYAYGSRNYYAQIRVSRSRRLMHADMRALGWPVASCVQGQCSGVVIYKNRAGKLRLTGQFAYLWLNVNDLECRAAELIAHESTHAAMRHCESIGVDLSDMQGEEALAYNVGHLTRQINDRLYQAKIFV